MAPLRRPPGPDALFVMPPGGVATGFTEHIGIGFLRAMLRAAGIAADQYLPPGAVGLADFARALAGWRPRLIGFTVYESNLRACRALAAVVRRVLPDAVLLAGGPNATFSPEETLELLAADACLRGAGEGTIVPIARAVLGSPAPRGRLTELLAAIPNLVLREADRVVRTAPASLASFQREHFRELDDLPSPWQAGLLTTPEAGLLTSRGCNQHCTYCSFAAISERKVAFHGVERVLEDVAAWSAHLRRRPGRPSSAPILDDAFTLSPERARRICEGLLARGLRLPLACQTRADRVDAALLRLMRRAGFTSVAFGLESAVPRVLRAIGKVQPPDGPSDPAFERERAWLDTFRTAVRQARAAGLLVHVSVIGGLPGETAADFRATLDFVESLRPAGYSHNLLQALPGTPLHRDLGRHGLSAARDADSGHWITSHAYDARAVRPRPGSDQRREGGVEALAILDALCGRPSQALAAPGGIWAVVVHGLSPAPAVSAWIGEVLAVGGLVLVVAGGEGAGAAGWRAWARSLREGRVAHGRLVLLAPGDDGGERVLRSVGTGQPHRIVRSTSWAIAEPPLEFDETGRCRARIWLAGDPAAVPPAGSPRRGAAVPQIADGCRWWTGWPRCRRPSLLHVREDGSVAACWSGPAVGVVGERLEALLGRAAALADRGGGACPIGPPPATPALRRALERSEVTSQLSARVEAFDLPSGAAGAKRRPPRARQRRAGAARRRQT